MKRVLRILSILTILGGIIGSYWFYQNRIVPPASAAANGGFTQIVAVRQGSLSNNLSVVGELEAVQSQDMKFSDMNGAATLKTLTVAAGNTVKQGQVLASIDAAPYQQAVDQAKSDLQASEKNLADLKATPTALKFAQADLAVAQAQYQIQEAQNGLDELVHPDLDKLKSDVAAAQNALAKAQSDLASKQNNKDDDQQLYDLQVAEATPAAEYNRLAAETYSDEFYQDRLHVAYNKMMDAQDARVTFEIQRKADLLKAQKQVRSAQQALADAQTKLAEAQKGGDPLARSKAELAVHDAEVSLASAMDSRKDLDAGADPTELASAQADVDKKRLAVTDAERALAGAQLVAPFDGTVLETHVQAGDEVTANKVVLSLANLKQLQVVASVDETTIRRVSAEQSADISFDAFPGQTFQGKVLAVPLQGELQGDVMVYQVPLSLEGTEQLPLRVGMTANISIQTERVENTLLVPTMALQRVNGGYQVRLVDPQNPQAQPMPVEVQVGLSDGLYTQITAGLQQGDQVVVELQASNNQSNNPFQRGFIVPGGGFAGGGGGFPGGGVRVPAR